MTCAGLDPFLVFFIADSRQRPGIKALLWGPLGVELLDYGYSKASNCCMVFFTGRTSMTDDNCWATTNYTRKLDQIRHFRIERDISIARKQREKWEEGEQKKSIHVKFNTQYELRRRTLAKVLHWSMFISNLCEKTTGKRQKRVINP